MRKPLNTSVPEELISEIDELVVRTNGSYRDRSHLVEQAIRAYMYDEGDGIALVHPAARQARPSREASSLYESSLFPRMRMNEGEKKAIAVQAASLVETGMTLFIDGSTSCIALAKVLANQRKGLTIVTNSTLICLELGKTAEHKVVGIGGDFDASSASFIGSYCEEAASSYYVDMSFLSTKGIILDDGTYESNTGTLRIKQVIAPHSSRVVLLADHTKFEQRSLRKVLDIAQIHTLVTDANVPQTIVKHLTESGHTVLVAPLKTPA